MVIMRRDHRGAPPFGTRHRRGAPFGGCNLECCAPGARKELVQRKAPLNVEARIAFLMGARNTAVPRLAHGCVASMRLLTQEICQKIFEFCSQMERHLVTQAPRPLPVAMRCDPDEVEDRGLGLAGLALCAPD